MFVMKECVISLLLVISLFNLSACQHHHHHHHHDSEEDHAEPNPAFKYSKEANQETKEQTHSHHKPGPKTATLDTQTLWLHAMGSTLIISAAPFFILFLVPLDSTDKDAPRFKYILAFASGGLLGDAFLHLIPHAAMSVAEGSGHGHSHGHDHDDDSHNHDMSVGLWVLLGIVVFLVVEKTVRILKASSYFQAPSIPKADSGAKKNKKKSGKKDETNGNEEAPHDIKVAGYLNLAADFSHNFTDGLAIGSSYLAGNTVGIVTTFTILCHEVPHEIGDFAILLQSGVKKRSAMMLQLATAVGALCGTAFSLWFQNSDGAQATPWILPFTAGGFIYIALVSVIPELLDEEKPTFKQTFWQIFALAAGVGLMVLVAYFE